MATFNARTPTAPGSDPGPTRLTEEVRLARLQAAKAFAERGEGQRSVLRLQGQSDTFMSSEELAAFRARS